MHGIYSHGRATTWPTFLVDILVLRSLRSSVDVFRNCFEIHGCPIKIVMHVREVGDLPFPFIDSRTHARKALHCQWRLKKRPSSHAQQGEDVFANGKRNARRLGNKQPGDPPALLRFFKQMEEDIQGTLETEQGDPPALRRLFK